MKYQEIGGGKSKVIDVGKLFYERYAWKGCENGGVSRPRPMEKAD